MMISVKLLSTYRKKLPDGTKGNSVSMDIPDGFNLEDVLKKFNIAYDQTNVVLVNGLTPEDSQSLSEGDEVCVFSAMAGG
jgi:sulfur carrier protein ThiS